MFVPLSTITSAGLDRSLITGHLLITGHVSRARRPFSILGEAEPHKRALDISRVVEAANRASRLESERSVSLRQAILTPPFKHQSPSAFSGTTVSPLTPPPTRSVHSLLWSVDFQPVPGFSAITDCASTTAPIHSVRLATNQLHEAIAQHRMILDHDNARLSLALLRSPSWEGTNSHLRAQRHTAGHNRAFSAIRLHFTRAADALGPVSHNAKTHSL